MNQKTPKLISDTARIPFLSWAKARAKTIQSEVASWPAAAPFLRKEQTPLAQYRAYGRKLATHPLMLMFLFAIPFSVLSGFTPRPFRDLSLTVNVSIMTVGAVIYFAAIWAWIGRWHYWGMAHNVPAVVIFCAFYTVAHFIFHVLFGGLLLDATFARTAQRFFITWPFALLLTGMAVMVFAPLTRSMLSKHGSLVPILWPISGQTARSVSIFEGADVGQLRWMQAEQKGTRVVTAQSVIFVRRALVDVIAQLQPNLGIHCHRRLWVAKSDVRDVVYLNGNPHVVLADEKVFPISRSAVDELRSLVLQRAAQKVTTD